MSSNGGDMLEKLRMTFDHKERSRRSVDCHEKSRKSVDHQLEKGRKSVDRLDRIRTAILWLMSDMITLGIEEKV
ncbi:alpha/beta hydrolase domain-containing protein 17C-like [Trifolium medium]|uniref:Alpha/beta hydrolase domain-containing protein 17C-like n=1 Tax=Trifolium medium TaxID=97028 RepID=A0A392QLW3_9FABA|nr:alpha/beta hydrolase domain-containing protein 17C-like [Trifolium medium]